MTDGVTLASYLSIIKLGKSIKSQLHEVILYVFLLSILEKPSIIAA